MNQEAHRRIIAERPAVKPWNYSRYFPGLMHDIPPPEQPPSPSYIPLSQPQHPNIPELSDRKRRIMRKPKAQHEERDAESLHLHIDDMQRAQREQHVLLEQYNTENKAREQQQMEMLVQFQQHQEERFDYFGNMLSGFFDRFSLWNPYLPPPPLQ